MNQPPPRPYATPAALRRALTDRLAAAAAEGPWRLADLQRQFAYDRLLHRLYLLDDGWILKGATALLARHLSVRHTIDLDSTAPEAPPTPNATYAQPRRLTPATGSSSRSAPVNRSPKASAAPAFP